MPSESLLSTSNSTTITPLGITKTLSILDHYIPLRKPVESAWTPKLESCPSSFSHNLESIPRSPSPAPSEMSDFEAPFASDFLKLVPICPTVQKQQAEHTEKLKREVSVLMKNAENDEDDDDDKRSHSGQKGGRGRPKGRKTSVKDRVTWVVVNMDEDREKEKQKSLVVPIEGGDSNGRALRARNRALAAKEISRRTTVGMDLSTSSEEEEYETSDEEGDDEEGYESESEEERQARKPKRSSVPSSSSEQPQKVPKRGRGRPRKIAQPPPLHSSVSPMLTSDEELPFKTTTVTATRMSPTPSQTDSQTGNSAKPLRRVVEKKPVNYAEESDVVSVSSGSDEEAANTIQPHPMQEARAQIPLPRKVDAVQKPSISHPSAPLASKRIPHVSIRPPHSQAYPYPPVMSMSTVASYNPMRPPYAHPRTYCYPPQAYQQYAQYAPLPALPLRQQSYPYPPFPPSNLQYYQKPTSLAKPAQIPLPTDSSAFSSSSAARSSMYLSHSSYPPHQVDTDYHHQQPYSTQQYMDYEPSPTAPNYERVSFANRMDSAASYSSSSSGEAYARPPLQAKQAYHPPYSQY
ncbi:UNVERIFIED_CONTAM: hypothetical protein HDU68_004422 [Siphonaria sp. JEL0065]|nr:hypothetical protein HDU68_004422 [Siphonaria sp. JEL0065]